MNKDQVKGRVKEAAGSAQKGLGRATDDSSQEAKGMAREQQGKMQKGWGDLKDKVRETREDTQPSGGTNRRSDT